MSSTRIFSKRNNKLQWRENVEKMTQSLLKDKLLSNLFRHFNVLVILYVRLYNYSLSSSTVIFDNNY